MITFLSSPKPFVGEADFNQRNAIRSWLTAVPNAEIILYGASEGAAELSAEWGLAHVPVVASAPSGLPYFGAIVNHAEENGRFDVQCYLNCDILLTPSIARAITSVAFKKFLLVGQRIDMAEGSRLEASNPGWWKAVEELQDSGLLELQPPTAIDYFVFPRGLWNGLLPLIIGRAGYDNALLGFCLRNGIPILDATETVLALHQFHGYGHAAGGRKEVYEGSDADSNRRVHDVRHSVPSIRDAQWRVRPAGITRVVAGGDLLRFAELRVKYNLKLTWLSYGFRAAWRIGRTLGLVGSHNVSQAHLIQRYLQNNE